MAKLKDMTKQEAYDAVVQYVITMDEKEYGDYVQYCEEGNHDPYDLQGREQRKHVYAQALIAWDREFGEL